MKKIGTGESVVLGQKEAKPKKQLELEVEKKKRRVPFRIAPDLKKEMTIQMVNEGYNTRQKSIWISKAIQDFLSDANWPNVDGIQTHPWKRIVLEQVTQVRNEDMKPETFLADMDTWIQVWRAAIDVAIYGSELEGENEEPVYEEISTAAVVRAAIAWKLCKI